MSSGDFDLIVVGGGIAGLTAANRVAQLGRRPLLLEKGTDELYLCNTRYTGGTLHVCMADIMSGEAAHLAAIEKLCDNARPDLARAMARNAERAVRWLQEEGCKFIKASASPHHRWVLAPPGRKGPGLDWKGRAGDVLLRRLGANLEERGGTFMRGVRVRSPLMDGQRCIGVEAEVGGEMTSFRAEAVILADGGFQAAPGLLREYITPRPDKVHQRNAGSGTGDGLQFALEAGAATVGTDKFYGHLLSLDALTNERLWPYPYLDAVVTAGILVGPDGRRFTDEGRGGVHVANSVAALEDPHGSYVVFDQTIWEGAGRHGLIPCNPHIPKEGGTLHTASSLADLADQIGMPATNLAETVSAFNSAVDAATIDALEPPRSTVKGEPVAVRTGPFYAMPVCAGITYTMGGIAIDGHARVLRPDDTPIDGLYAAGTTTGGLEGGSGAGYVGGLSKSTVTALLAAESAVGEMKMLSA